MPYFDANQAYLTYSTILRALEKLIDDAQTPEEKFILVTKCRSLSAFTKVITGALTLEEAIAEQAENKYDSTNALALAICLGKPQSVKKMLALFNDISINDESNFVWGYRQPYSFLHLAAHPHVVIDISDASPNEDLYVDAQIAIIKLLGKCGANPNLVVQQQHYTNPAIAVGFPMGHTHFSHNQRSRLRASLLLIGADPHYIGSSYRLEEADLSDAIQEATKQYVMMSKAESNLASLVLHKDVAIRITANLHQVLRQLNSECELSVNASGVIPAISGVDSFDAYTKTNQASLSSSTQSSASSRLSNPLYFLSSTSFIHSNVRLPTRLAIGPQNMPLTMAPAAMTTTTFALTRPPEGVAVVGHLMLGMVALHVVPSVYSWFKGKLFGAPIKQGARPVASTGLIEASSAEMKRQLGKQ
jgi:hypothetical protein